MDLNQYITTNLLRTSAAPPAIELPRDLFDMMLDVREISEEAGVEFGCNLYFQDGALSWGETVRGTKEDTELDTGVERVKADYIGDFHTHPYRHRLDDDASIGPSVSDLMEMIGKRPKRMPIGVYFVFGGHILHLIVLTRETRKLKHVTSPGLDDRENVKNFLAFEGVGYSHEFYERPEDGSPSDSNYIENLQIERKSSRSVPRYPEIFSNSNFGTNLRAAAIYDYEYYTADLRTTDNNRRLRTEDGLITCLRQRTPGQSPGTGLVCARCGAIHSRSHSSVFGRWHKCRECRAVYCPTCGDRLQRPVYLTRERKCPLLDCGGRTELLY